MNTELIAIDGVASLLKCSPKTIRDWLYRDRKHPDTDPLPYYRIGGLVRFNADEIQAWVTRRRVRVVSR